MSKLNFRKIKHDVKPENSGPWHSSSEFSFQLGQLVGATCFLLLETLEDLKWIAFFNIAERVDELHDNTVPLEEEFYLFFFFTNLWDCLQEEMCYVPVCVGCHNKMLQNESFKHQKLIILQFWAHLLSDKSSLPGL